MTKIRCARCDKTLMIGDLTAGEFTIKCKKCGAVNLILVHPQINIQEVSPARFNDKKEVMGVSLPKIHPTLVTIK